MTLSAFIAMRLIVTLNIILMWQYLGECKLTSLNLPFHYTARMFFSQVSEKCWRVFYRLTGWEQQEKRELRAVNLHVTRTPIFWPWGFLLRSEKCLQINWFICWLPYLFAILHQLVFPSIVQLSDWMPAMWKVFYMDSKLIETFFRNTAFLVFQSSQGDDRTHK